MTALLAPAAVAVLAVAAAVARLRLAARPAPRAPRATAQPRRGSFPRYHEIRSTLYSSAGSRYYFDRVLRPMLWQLITATATGRHGVVAARDRSWLRARIGDELWPLVDPERPEWTDRPGERARGPDEATLHRLVDRIEGI